MAIPMAVLYEVGHLFARLAHRKAVSAELTT